MGIEIVTQPDETIEDLQLCGLKILQKKHGFRFGMDAVLLADFARIHPDDLVADFGTGTGILPLLLIGRGKGRSFLAFEIQEEMARMAQRTMEMNRLTDRVNVLHADAGDAESWTDRCSVDPVICNPPYGQIGKTMVNPDPSRSISRHQEPDSFQRMLNSAFRILRGKGKIFLIYPASQLLVLFSALQKAHLEPKRFRLVYPYLRSPANLALVEAVKDARPGLQPMSPLILYQSDGSLTNELKSVYHIIEKNEV